MTIVIISDDFFHGMFNIRKISKDDHTLINVLRQEKNWSSQRLFMRKFSGKNCAWTSVDLLLKKINFTGVTERPKIRMKLEGRWTFRGRLFGVLQSMIFS